MFPSESSLRHFTVAALHQVLQLFVSRCTVIGDDSQRWFCTPAGGLVCHLLSLGGTVRC